MKKLPLKVSLFLFLLINFTLLTAQEPSFLQRVKRIDSLILYTNLSLAEKEADILYDDVTKKTFGTKYIDVQVAVLLLKANIYGLREDNTKTIQLLLTAIDLARNHHLPKKEYRASLLTALVYEVAGDFKLCKLYLEKAHDLYTANGLTALYSTYCIRTSSYYRLTGESDSALFYAQEALHYAIQYPNRRDLADAYILLSILLKNINYQESIQFASLAANEFMDRHDYPGVAAMHGNICRSYQSQKQYKKAFLHNDTTLLLTKKYNLSNSIYSLALKHRQELFDSTGRPDSAYIYFKAYHQAYLQSLEEQDAIEIKTITEKYQNVKRDAVIKSKDQQLFFIILLLTVIATASVLILRKNKKINRQNKVIRRQIDDLTKMLEQKKLLLSELQHRVKNNLQHVISLLEIQKESVNYNNIDEIIRANQNRIQSIALLHKKLNVLESVSEVNLEKYLFELSDLVKNSYDIKTERVSLDLQCDIEKMSIEKALPVGLIIVELISNSMKHAFSQQVLGAIQIHLNYDEQSGMNRLLYADNGQGFDFNSAGDKGLGLEIIKGLMDQLNGTIESRFGDRFELTMYFK